MLRQKSPMLCLAGPDTPDYVLTFHFVEIIFNAVYFPAKLGGDFPLCDIRPLLNQPQYRFRLLKFMGYFAGYSHIPTVKQSRRK